MFWSLVLGLWERGRLISPPPPPPSSVFNSAHEYKNTQSKVVLQGEVRGRKGGGAQRQCCQLEFLL